MWNCQIIDAHLARIYCKAFGKTARSFGTMELCRKTGVSPKGILHMLQKWFSRGKEDEETRTDADNFDVVLVLAGMNDMKDILLPFLAYETVDSLFGD
ncbi:hypothetical protein ACHAWF_015569, partial [Thalassiosira exigua]